MLDGGDVAVTDLDPRDAIPDVTAVLPGHGSQLTELGLVTDVLLPTAPGHLEALAA